MRGRSRTRSTGRPPLQSQSPVLGSPLPSPGHMGRRVRDEHGFYRSTSLETRSRTPSPTSQSPSQQEYYGSTNLIDRSRSPSPAQSPPKRTPRKLPSVPFVPTTPPPGMGPGHVAVPVGGRGGVSGAGAATKPVSLNLTQPKLKEAMPRVMPSPTIPQAPKSPGNINFPRLSASPTRLPRNIRAEDGRGGGGGVGPGGGANPHHHHPSRGGGAGRQMPHPSAHHVPPPGRLARPEPYSPTERNNLNKGDVGGGSPHKPYSRTSARGAGFHDDPSWGRGGERDRDQGPDQGVGLRGPTGRSPDLRTGDRRRILAHQFDSPPTEPAVVTGAAGVSGRGRARPTPTLPNGFKPKTGRKQERYEMRSDINVPLKEDSDEDDDWCWLHGQHHVLWNYTKEFCFYLLLLPPPPPPHTHTHPLAHWIFHLCWVNSLTRFLLTWIRYWLSLVE